MISRLSIFTALFLALIAVAYGDSGFEARFLERVETVERREMPFSNFFLLVQNTKNYSYQSPMKMHDLIDQYMERLFKDRSKGEKEYFLRQYLDKNNVSTMGSADKVLFEKNIQRMLEYIYGQSGAEFLEKNACPAGSTQPKLELLLNQLKDFEKVMRCRDLKVGEANVFDQPGNPKENGVLAPGYSLERVTDKKYLVRVSINYHAEDQAVKKEFETGLQACLNKINPYLNGPNGTSITIQNVSPSDLNLIALEKRPPLSEIDVMEAGARSNSKAFSKDADCNTLAHEVLHILGLADEYEERWDYNTYDPVTGVVSREKNAKPVFNYNCRIVSSVPSMMKQPWEMMSLVIDSKSESSPKSLLYPQQFERIIGGLCPEKGSNYSRCAAFAYVTDATEKCEGVPKECKDMKYFLGDLR